MVYFYNKNDKDKRKGKRRGKWNNSHSPRLPFRPLIFTEGRGRQGKGKRKKDRGEERKLGKEGGRKKRGNGREEKGEFEVLL